MPPQPVRRRVPLADGPLPGVSADVYEPASPAGSPVVVLAHGAGSRLDHPVHRGVAGAVADAGATVVTFNFAYTEAGRKAPDRMPRLLECWRAVIDWTRTELPNRPLVVGGRSMGGRVASLLAAEDDDVAGLVLMNYPLIPAAARADAPPRTDHWPQLTVPILFVHGTRDRLLPPALFEASRPLLAGADVTTHVVDDADHSFAVRRSTGRSSAEVYTEIAQAVTTWLARLQVAA